MQAHRQRLSELPQGDNADSAVLFVAIYERHIVDHADALPIFHERQHLFDATSLDPVAQRYLTEGRLQSFRLPLVQRQEQDETASDLERGFVPP